MRIWWSITFILTTYSLHAQERNEETIDLNTIADEFYGIQDEDLNYEELFENLVQLLSHPLNLNKATAEQLRFIKVLSEIQIQNLIKYRHEHGDFLSIYELQAVPGFDPHFLSRLVPFVEVTDPIESLNHSFLKRVLKGGDDYFLFRYEQTLESKKGFERSINEDDQFKGSPEKLYLRFRSSRPGDYSIGFTAEKDQGEKLQWSKRNQQYGFDYWSFHAQIQNKGKIKNLILGDFQTQFGQGLILGGIFGMGKGGETITTTRRSNIGMMPYTSVYEAGYLRGGGATLSLHKNVTVTTFYSNTKRDATIEDDDESTITSFQTTGLHRNNKEIAKRKQVGESIVGGGLQYQKNQLDAGILFQHANFTGSVSPASRIYNQFDFKGEQNTNASLYLNYTLNNIAFFSEIAQTVGHGHAYVAGALLSLTSKFDVSILHRRFSKNFYSFYANAFTEGSTSQNETGTYWGWKYRFNRKINTVGYVDLFRFPWLKYRSYTPSSGYEYMLRINYQPSKTVLIFIQGREECKVRNHTNSTNLYQTGEGIKRNAWINFDYKVGSHLGFKTRAQFSSFKFEGMTTRGSTLFQDVSINQGKFQITARYALFDTDDYDNRHYVYENDVWLAYSLPAYYGEGVRKYILVEYKLNKLISFWVRYAHTSYTDRKVIGTGLDAIEGNVKNDIKFETRIRF